MFKATLFSDTLPFHVYSNVCFAYSAENIEIGTRVNKRLYRPAGALPSLHTHDNSHSPYTFSSSLGIRGALTCQPSLAGDL